MKLVAIEFHGFKSFADSAEIRFHDGITAIVGPNGCGKSNISDGLRWVLGEQKPSAIRGARMEEAIFQGTERRRPIQRAEVTLRLSNEDHLLPVPYTDVEISRTVYTGGESEYRLNGTLCRLRDVQDLCRDTGLGANAYAIIEARMIDAILSDRAEERREMFEEAAGIGRYKERRRVAMRRLDEADADLARVDDLISEVQTKVRSLARQRGKARRYLEMRERKLALELALAQAELTRLDRHRCEIDSELGSLQTAGVEDAARLRSTEAQCERSRASLLDLERKRADAARRLMELRDQLAERERRRLLAEERQGHARKRLEQVAREREELEQQKVQLRETLQRLQQEVGERQAALAALRDALTAREGELTGLDQRRRAMEAAQAAAESERRSYRERRARLQAGRDAARAEAAELARRVEEAEKRLAAAASTLEQAGRAAEEARTEAARAEERLQRITVELEGERSHLSELRAEYEELRGHRVALAERLQAVSARIDDLLPLTSGDEGFSPAVQAALARAAELGIRDVLGRGIDVPEAFAEGVGAFLGEYMEGLVVDDDEAVERVRRWFLHEYDGPGGLVVLPLDRVEPIPASPMELPGGIRVSGPGAPWLAHLLKGVELGDAPEGGRAWIGRRESLDATGAFRFGRPSLAASLLARKAELERLQARRAELESELQRLAALAGASEQRAAALAAEVADLESQRRAAEEEAGRLAARAEAAAERLSRLHDELESARRGLADLEQERETALSRAAADEEALRSLKPADAAAAPEPEALAEVRAEWERLRERVSELQLEEAKTAASYDRAEREHGTRQQALADVSARGERLAGEAEDLTAGEARWREEAESAARELHALFEEQARLERDAREMEERVEATRREVSDLDLQLRKVQQEEREHAERRHELELEKTQIEAELQRTRERLEDEWGRPFDELAGEVEPAAGQPEGLRRELSEVAERLAGIGPVNMLAEQEYQEEKERLEFLQGQREDLVKARDDLRATIRRINETASAAFLETLEKIRTNFKRTFATLFEGGECDVWLEDPEAPLDSPVEISASPRGKRTQRIHLLSGGERALTALSLLFAIYLVKPSPFCVMDEVDAPLDETNILRFVAMLEEFKSGVQFIIITHNPVTIEAADWIYGVTMEEPGVSKIVGVEFSDYARGAVA